MTTANYPSNINNKFLYPYETRVQAYVIKDENDVGTPKERLRASDPTIYHKMSIRYTHAEFEIFKHWVQYDLQCGVLPFNLTFKTPNAEAETKTVKFVINDGLAYDVDVDESRVLVEFEIYEV